MDDKDLEIFTRPNPEAHAQYIRAKKRKRAKEFKDKLKRSCKIASQIILWICAVGGFVLSLIQFFQN